MTKKQTKGAVLLFVCSLLIAITLDAQLTFTGQLRTRTELRDGLGNLVLKDSKSAFFTSQRTRLVFGYKWDRLTFGASIQDVRVWGQDASSINNGDGNRLMLHEGWAELVLFNSADTNFKHKVVDLMSLKIGRQELIYDDSRLIGNLDWLQQARRHDMILLKTFHHGWQMDLGLAFNQNTDAFGYTNTNYLPANVAPYVKNSIGILVPTPAGLLPMAPAGSAANNSSKTGSPVWLNPPNTNGGNQQYKSFTSLYLSKKFKQTKFSGLFFNDNFGHYKMDSVGSNAAGYVYGKRFVSSGSTDAFDYYENPSRYTYGLMVNHTIGKSSEIGSIHLQAAIYAQSGENREGVKMKNAYHYMAMASFQKGKISLTPGYEVLSGDDASTGGDEKFDPLYGTPHRHWGYMDYFYAGTGSPAGGLKNAYFKIKYTGKSLNMGADLHFFSLEKDMRKSDGKFIDKKLGNELDLLLTYTMNRFTQIELGYSIMKAGSGMPIAKGQSQSDVVANAYGKTGTWLYAMIRFSPDFLHVKSSTAKPNQ